MHKRGYTSIQVLLLNAGWHPKAGRFLGKMWYQGKLNYVKTILDILGIALHFDWA